MDTLGLVWTLRDMLVTLKRLDIIREYAFSIDNDVIRVWSGPRDDWGNYEVQCGYLKLSKYIREYGSLKEAYDER